MFKEIENISEIFLHGETQEKTGECKRIPYTQGYYRLDNWIGFVVKKKRKKVFVEKSLYNVNEWAKKNTAHDRP